MAFKHLEGSVILLLNLKKYESLKNLICLSAGVATN